MCSLSSQVDELHRGQHPEIFQKPDGPAREREYIQGVLEDACSEIFVAELQGNIIGFVTVMVLDARPIPILVPRRYVVVDNLVIDEHHRRLGVGSCLMSRAEQWAIENSATAIELSVYRFNQGAVELYTKLGYKDISVKMRKFL